MSALVTLRDGQPVTTTLAIAEGTDNDHASVIKLVRTYEADLAEFGPVVFEARSQAKGNSGFEIANPGAGRPTEFANLNEPQAALLMTYMRNTPIVRTFKKALVREFFSMATQLRGKRRTPPRMTVKASESIAAHFLMAKALEGAGVSVGMATSVALDAIHRDTGLTTEPYRLALPAVENPCALNQTEVGEEIGLSPVEVGKRLRALGLMADDSAGNRYVTDAGKQYGAMIPFTKNGHSGIEPRWRREVAEVLKGATA